jgi:hypothetical protein
MESKSRRLFAVSNYCPNRKNVGGGEQMTMEQPTDQQVDRFFKEIDESPLGEWETKFMLSTRTYWLKSRRLSPKQRARLSEIWKRQHPPRSA